MAAATYVGVEKLEGAKLRRSNFTKAYNNAVFIHSNETCVLILSYTIYLICRHYLWWYTNYIFINIILVSYCQNDAL